MSIPNIFDPNVNPRIPDPIGAEAKDRNVIPKPFQLTPEIVREGIKSLTPEQAKLIYEELLRQHPQLQQQAIHKEVLPDPGKIAEIQEMDKVRRSQVEDVKKPK